MMRRTLLTVAASVLAAVFLGGGAHAAILFVDNHSAGVSTCWNGHFLDIQSAVAAARTGDQIWVRRGTYAENVVLGPTASGVALYGGFWGGEMTLAGRQFNAFSYSYYKTIINGGGAPASAVKVESCSTPAQPCLIDGFVITNGLGTLDANACYDGGGILVVSSNAVIRNNIIRQNGQTSGSVNNAGAGIYFWASGGSIAGNVIQDNSAFAGASQLYAYGGGVVLNNASPVISGNKFIRNRCSERGGALMTHVNSSPVIKSNLFWQNTADKDGGAVAAFYFNSTADYLQILNNTFLGNSSASQGGDIFLDTNTSGNIENNIFSGNSLIIKALSPALATVSHNDLQGYSTTAHPGLVLGPGNINADPLFAKAVSGIVRLRHSPLSPCLDAGDNSCVIASTDRDLDGKARIVDGMVDMGCFESGSIPPYTTCALSGTLGMNGWYTGSAVTATLTPSEAVAYTKWAYVGTNGRPPAYYNYYSAPVSLTLGGPQAICYFSEDKDGNIEAVRSTPYNLDSTLPSLAISSPASTRTTYATASPYPFAGTALDYTSGLLSVGWKSAQGGSGICAGTASWSASVPLAEGTNVVTITARDQAGNQTAQSRTVVLDTMAPAIPAPPTGGKYTLAISITFNEQVKAGSALAGISVIDPAARKPTNLVTNASAYGNQLVLTCTLSARKTYTVTLPASCVTDLAGNPFAGATFSYATTR